MEPLLAVRGLVKRYGGVAAVDDVGFEVFAGEIFGLLGANGAGKTTTFEIIEGLRPPDHGEVRICGRDARAAPAAVKGLLGVQLQTTALFESLTVEESLRLFASLYGRPGPPDGLLDRLLLDEHRSTRVGALSGGQQQRVSLALALVNRPRVLVLDEPTSGMDPQSRRHVWDLLREMRAEGVAIALTTHNMDEADLLCDRIAIIDAGRIVAVGDPASLVRSVGGSATVEIDAAGVPLADLEEDLRPATVHDKDARIAILTSTPESTVERLFASARSKGFAVRDLVVRPATLEDAYLSITGHALRD